MKKFILHTFALCTLAFSSCEKVVNIDLNEGNTRLVVEGTLKHYKDEPTNGFQSFNLTTTYPYFETNPDNALRNATVTITDDTDNTETVLTESQPGIYTTNDLVTQLNHQYTLHIECEIEGATQQYEATDIMRPVTDISNIYQEFQEETLFDDEGYYVRIDISDPANEKNYYKWDTYINGENALEEINGGTKRETIRDDEYLGEDTKGISVYDKVAVPGDNVRIEQYSASEAMYYYYFNFYGLIAESGGDIPPAPVIGNIKNINDPENYGLGFFGVSEVTVKSLTIVEDQ